MKIVADERIAALDETFGHHGEITRRRGADISRRDLLVADALLVRTITRVDAALLEGTPVRFVGTATIGFDHLDTAFLDSAGIHWTNAPGCNADATAQYTLAMYLLACRRLELDPCTRKYGIVGRGNVGGRLMQLLAALGIEAIACDPPLEAQGQSGLVPMSDILECGAISLHVPLIREGRWPTYKMMNLRFFRHISTQTLLVNSARGDVIEGDALTAWMASGGAAALDVWPGEPEIDANMLVSSVVATPHVAGYSIDGKNRASAMIYRAFCACFDLAATAGPAVEDRGPGEPRLRGTELADAILSGTPVEQDDASMRRLLDLPDGRRAVAFEALRANYSLRRDLTL